MHICTLDLDAYFNICITHFHTVRGVPNHAVVPNGAMPNSIQILNTFSVNCRHKKIASKHIQKAFSLKISALRKEKSF